MGRLVITRAQRQRNPRVVALEKINKMRDRLTWLRHRWTRDRGWSGATAARVRAEMEWDADEWQNMADHLHTLALEADALCQEALARVEKIKREKGNGS